MESLGYNSQNQKAGNACTKITCVDVNMDRLEEQILLHSPSLRHTNDAIKRAIRNRLYSQLLRSFPVVHLMKLDVPDMLLSVENNLLKCKNLGILAKKNKVCKTFAKPYPVVDIQLSRLNSIDDRAISIKSASSDLKQSRFSPVESDGSDLEEDMPLLLRRKPRKRSNEYDFSRTSYSHCCHCNNRTSTHCTSPKDNINADSTNHSNSSVTWNIAVPRVYREGETLVEFSIDLGNNELPRKVFDGKVERILQNNGFGKNSKNRRGRKKRKKGSCNEARKQSKQKVKSNEHIEVSTSDQVSESAEHDILSCLISEVLMEPSASEPLRAVNDLKEINNFGTSCNAENVNGNISGHHEKSKAQDESGIFSTDLPKSQHNIATKDKLKKKVKKPYVPKGTPKKCGRKSKQTSHENSRTHANKSDLAKYVELFSDCISSDCNVSCATPISPSEPQVDTLTTQEFQESEQISTQTAQIAYLLNGEWTDGGVCQIISSNIGNANLDTCNIAQDDLNVNVPFEDFVNYIDSSHTDVGNNVIARVLDGSSATPSSITCGMVDASNMILGRDNSTEHIIKLPGEQKSNRCSECQAKIKTGNVGSSPFISAFQTSSIFQTNRFFSPPSHAHYHCSDSVIDLSRKSDAFNMEITTNESDKVANAGCVAIDLSIKNKNTDVQQKYSDGNNELVQDEDESDENFLHRLIENSGFDDKIDDTNQNYESTERTNLIIKAIVNENESFKAALDMPLLNNDELISAIKPVQTQENGILLTNSADCLTGFEGEKNVEESSKITIDNHLNILAPLSSLNKHTNDDIYDMKESGECIHEPELQSSEFGNDNSRIYNIEDLENPPTHVRVMLKSKAFVNDSSDVLNNKAGSQNSDNNSSESHIVPTHEELLLDIGRDYLKQNSKESINNSLITAENIEDNLGSLTKVNSNEDSPYEEQYAKDNNGKEYLNNYDRSKYGASIEERNINQNDSVKIKLAKTKVLHKEEKEKVEANTKSWKTVNTIIESSEEINCENKCVGENESNEADLGLKLNSIDNRKLLKKNEHYNNESNEKFDIEDNEDLKKSQILPCYDVLCYSGRASTENCTEHFFDKNVYIDSIQSPENKLDTLSNEVLPKKGSSKLQIISILSVDSLIHIRENEDNYFLRRTLNINSKNFSSKQIKNMDKLCNKICKNRKRNRNNEVLGDDEYVNNKKKIKVELIGCTKENENKVSDNAPKAIATQAIINAADISQMENINISRGESMEAKEGLHETSDDSMGLEIQVSPNSQQMKPNTQTEEVAMFEYVEDFLDNHRNVDNELETITPYMADGNVKTLLTIQEYSNQRMKKILAIACNESYNDPKLLLDLAENTCNINRIDDRCTFTQIIHKDVEENVGTTLILERKCSYNVKVDKPQTIGDHSYVLPPLESFQMYNNHDIYDMKESRKSINVLEPQSSEFRNDNSKINTMGNLGKTVTNFLFMFQSKDFVNFCSEDIEDKVPSKKKYDNTSETILVEDKPQEEESLIMPNDVEIFLDIGSRNHLKASTSREHHFKDNLSKSLITAEETGHNLGRPNENTKANSNEDFVYEEQYAKDNNDREYRDNYDRTNDFYNCVALIEESDINQNVSIKIKLEKIKASYMEEKEKEEANTKCCETVNMIIESSKEDKCENNCVGENESNKTSQEADLGSKLDSIDNRKLLEENEHYKNESNKKTGFEEYEDIKKLQLLPCYDGLSYSGQVLADTRNCIATIFDNNVHIDSVQTLENKPDTFSNEVLLKEGPAKLQIISFLSADTLIVISEEEDNDLIRRTLKIDSKKLSEVAPEIINFIKSNQNDQNTRVKANEIKDAHKLCNSNCNDNADTLQGGVVNPCENFLKVGSSKTNLKRNLDNARLGNDEYVAKKKKRFEAVWITKENGNIVTKAVVKQEILDIRDAADISQIGNINISKEESTEAKEGLHKTPDDSMAFEFQVSLISQGMKPNSQTEEAATYEYAEEILDVINHDVKDLEALMANTDGNVETVSVNQECLYQQKKNIEEIACYGSYSDPGLLPDCAENTCNSSKSTFTQIIHKNVEENVETALTSERNFSDTLKVVGKKEFYVQRRTGAVFVDKLNTINKETMLPNMSVLELEIAHDACIDVDSQSEDDYMSLATSCFNSPDDDRFRGSKMVDETQNVDVANYFENHMEIDYIKLESEEIDQSENGKPTEEGLKDPLSMLPKFQILEQWAARKITNQQVNEPAATAKKIYFTKVGENVCAVMPWMLQIREPLVIELPTFGSSCVMSRGQFAGRGGEAVNRGVAFRDVLKFFGSTCLLCLVNKCPISGSSLHQFRDPTVLQIGLEGLPDMELNAAYRFMFNHTMLFKRYFFVFCNVYSKLNNRNRLLDMVYDCERYSGCAPFLRNVFYGLLRCGLSKVSACRLILQRSRDKSVATINALISIIFETDWALFCEYLEEYAKIPYYAFPIYVVNDMAARALHTKELKLYTVVWNCLLTLRRDDFALVYENFYILSFLEMLENEHIR